MLSLTITLITIAYCSVRLYKDPVVKIGPGYHIYTSPKPLAFAVVAVVAWANLTAIVMGDR